MSWHYSAHVQGLHANGKYFKQETVLLNHTTAPLYWLPIAWHHLLCFSFDSFQGHSLFFLPNQRMPPLMNKLTSLASKLSTFPFSVLSHYSPLLVSLGIGTVLFSANTGWIFTKVIIHLQFISNSLKSLVQCNFTKCVVRKIRSLKNIYEKHINASIKEMIVSKKVQQWIRTWVWELTNLS